MNPKNHREKILKTAEDLIYRRGYHATSIGDIARSARVPKGSLYNHFKGKEDLASCLLDRYGERALAKLQSRLGKNGEPPSKLVYRLMDHYIRSYRKHGYRHGCSLGSRLNEVADTDPVLSRKIVKILDAWASVLEDRFREWGKNHGRKDISRAAPHLARTVQATMQGALLQMKGKRNPAPLRDARDTLKVLLEAYERGRSNGRGRKRRRT